MICRRLEPVYPVTPVDVGAADSHPMRRVTEEIATDSRSWTPERSSKVIQLFDSMAKEWVTMANSARMLPVRDAVERGGVAPSSRVLEAGCGSGSLSPLLRNAFAQVVSVDISEAMLREVTLDDGTFLRADCSRLPFPDSTFDAVFVVNMFLFAAEYRRILKPTGTLVWISSLADRTPIYLAPSKVAEVLGSTFSGVWSDAGSGRWSAFRRADGVES